MPNFDSVRPIQYSSFLLQLGPGPAASRPPSIYPFSSLLFSPSFESFLSGQEAEVEGTLSVQPQANPVRGFQQYFLNLTVENNERNPWFSGEWRPASEQATF